MYKVLKYNPTAVGNNDFHGHYLTPEMPPERYSGILLRRKHIDRVTSQS